MSDLPAFLRRIAPMQWADWWETDLLAAADRIVELEAEVAALEVENADLREKLRDWPWVPAIDVEAFYGNQARDQ